MTHTQNAILAVLFGALAAIALTLVVMTGSPPPATPPQPTPYPTAAVHR